MTAKSALRARLLRLERRAHRHAWSLPDGRADRWFAVSQWARNAADALYGLCPDPGPCPCRTTK